MPSLSYKMIVTQFTEHQWNNMISPTIQATLNATSIVCNLAHTVLYGSKDYQGLSVKNPFFLHEIIYTIAFLNEAVCNSSTGQLLRANAKAFRVEIGIPFAFTSTPYNENTFAYCLPYCWYKSLLRFTSNALYMFNISEDYPDLHLLQDDSFLCKLLLMLGSLI